MVLLPVTAHEGSTDTFSLRQCTSMLGVGLGVGDGEEAWPVVWFPSSWTGSSRDALPAKEDAVDVAKPEDTSCNPVVVVSDMFEEVRIRVLGGKEEESTTALRVNPNP